MRTPIKLMTFNILMGGGDRDRFTSILELLNRHKPDILVLQECLDWDDGQRLALVAQCLDIPCTDEHARLGQGRPRGSGKRYHLGIFSRLPIQSFTAHNNPAFQGHCLAEFSVDWNGQPLTVFGTHFDSKNENLRFVEARYLSSLLDNARFRKGYYALAGDLNSLSPADPYPADLEALLRQSLTTKYHLPPRFEVMRELADFGWRDGLYLKPPVRWITAVRHLGGVHIDYRTDYLMFSPELAEHAAQVEVLPLHDESDHSPVMALLI